ncbi:protein CcdC [Alicyclobacillus contaminans]|uniref:CcdC family protein n=1 Tax=Alicyclobacillus contaminans TaxID=392016 RepID=UPI001FE0A934|nr:cytochrome c biogenesis protein CcdC [Alicyclobacillus contaminans]GMA51886.1 protein CcdC [Alicyclobacillus contaminans]
MIAAWISSIILILFALSVIVIRLKASKSPTSAKKILIPPVGMSTGFLMFVVPETHVPLSYAGLAILAGLLLCAPLVATSRMFVADGKVYLKRSKGFVVVLLVLVVLRIALHQYIEDYVSIPQTAALFFILAFSMLLPWRILMYLNYRRLRATAALPREQVS